MWCSQINLYSGETSYHHNDNNDSNPVVVDRELHIQTLKVPTTEEITKSECFKLFCDLTQKLNYVNKRTNKKAFR